ncbi:MAG: acetyltransferase [Aeoliella sp.]
MPTRIVIVGAGGFGREVRAWMNHIEGTDNDYRVAGFLDANNDALCHFDIDEPVLGNPMDYLPQSCERFVIAIGDPETKLRLAESLESRGAQFVTLVHPTAVVGPRCPIGQGVVICPHATVTCDAQLEDFAMLNIGSSVGHDAHIGRGSTLSGHADVTGGARLEEGVFMGSHASVLPGVTIGAGATVAAGSIAMRNVPAGSTVVGVPAKKLPTLLKRTA